MEKYVFIINSNLEFDNSNKKIAAFDYDWTIVKPKGGREFPRDENDWKWLRPNVPENIKKYYNDGYAIYVFTNQTKEWKLVHIENSLSQLEIPIKVVVGFGKLNKIIKPNPVLFLDNAPIIFDKGNSFYCGDAAGRPSDWSNVDITFANNVGIKFKIPESCFPIELQKPDHNTICKIDYEKDTQEIIILVGYPASGKTTFASNYLKTYVIINGDELKTVARMLKCAKSYIQNSYSVVIDATNGRLDNRKCFIDFAQCYNIDIRCFVFNTSMEDALEWNTKRMNETGKKVPNIAFYTYRKYYTIPTLSEGFDEIVYI